uniref:protein mono-ADP-ribosyltransferase TIPARP-like n=1 Tax=Epinephelus lanceolatus TaxID=310571 RepID=UPI001446CAEC|nr:protein mono-ADP-ribosyltransferase TIPARP-like [Epinephelus lanceolatus]
MPYVPSSRGTKRKLADDAVGLQPQSKSSKVTFLSPSLILLELPSDTNSSFPVWEAMRSQQVDVAWTVNPYSAMVHFTPVTSQQGKRTNSSQTEDTSSATQSSVPFSGIPQPQLAIQSITQLHSTSQNSCVVLTLSQDSTQLAPSLPGQLLYTPPTPTPVTSVIITLPLTITQPQPAFQPSTPTKRITIQTPPATPTMPQAPSKVPDPNLFHTRSSANIEICDNFLLGLCQAGRKCKMHHTPYPFHWQLWSVVTHRWIDIPLRSQVLMEKLYCDVNQEAICVKDGPVCNTLNFDSMDVDDISKYDKVRRLTNSDSLIRNPHFPSRWKFFWWNSMDWEEYNKDASAVLLQNMNEKEPECTLTIGSQQYKVDFTSMVQTNVTTGFEREVRCRPVYRSPVSMQPYLKTEVKTKPDSDPPAANFSVDPLKEFSSWYPPVWSVTSEDYSLVDVPAGTEAYRSLLNLFCESLPETRVDIVSIQQVQSLLHWDKYQRQKAFMQKQHADLKNPLERHLFHGTTKKASEDICYNNFDPRVAGVNGTSHGVGSYFASTASFSHTFSAVVASDEVRHMFLAKVLVGKVCLGRHNYHRPPPLYSTTRKFCLYDSCVDNVDKPTIFVVFDSCQCYPYYLIKYKDLPKEVEI